MTWRGPRSTYHDMARPPPRVPRRRSCKRDAQPLRFLQYRAEMIYLI